MAIVLSLLNTAVLQMLAVALLRYSHYNTSCCLLARRTVYGTPQLSSSFW